MKTPLFFLTACLAISISQTAQCQIDPGAPDSIILEQGIQMPYLPGQYSTTPIDIYFVTDEDITVIYFILTWDCIDDRVYFGLSDWSDMFFWADVYDSISIPDHMISSLLFLSSEDPFNSHGQRVLVCRLRLVIMPEAQPQIITINQLEVPIFATPDSEWYPVLIPTRIIYGTPQGINEQPTLPAKITLSQNYPNPFNSNTLIAYDLSQDCEVALEIYNILGQRVKAIGLGPQNAGANRIYYDGTDDFGAALPSGTYLYRLKAGDMQAVQKMTILR
jgi:hypothetical protein